MKWELLCKDITEEHWDKQMTLKWSGSENLSFEGNFVDFWKFSKLDLNVDLR